ncbi:hypothetical protein D3C87_1442580 [compost metagenome]
MAPHGVQPALAPDHPNQRHADQNTGRRTPILPAAQHRNAVENQKVAAKNEQIADGRADRAGQVAAEQRRRATDCERGESRSQDSQFLAALGIGPLLPERQPGTGEQRADC